jgi:transcriptional regulator with XRE-family HTH domain
LRQIRTGRSLSLRQVTVRSGGRFKPSSIASYERGERQISLERLFALAHV